MSMTYYTVKEAAQILHTSESYVRNRIKDKSIKASKLGRAYIIEDAALKAFIESMEKNE